MSAHPSNKRSLDLQSLPVTAERMVMWGLIAALSKLTNPTLKIALRFPSQAEGLNLLGLAGRLPKTLDGSSKAVTQQTTPSFYLLPSFTTLFLSAFPFFLAFSKVFFRRARAPFFHFQFPSSLLPS